MSLLVSGCDICPTMWRPVWGLTAGDSRVLGVFLRSPRVRLPDTPGRSDVRAVCIPQTLVHSTFTTARLQTFSGFSSDFLSRLLGGSEQSFHLRGDVQSVCGDSGWFEEMDTFEGLWSEAHTPFVSFSLSGCRTPVGRVLGPPRAHTHVLPLSGARAGRGPCAE